MKAKAIVALLFGTLLLSACDLTIDTRKSSDITPENSSSIGSSKDATLNKAMSDLSNPKHSMTTTVDGKNYGSIYFTNKGYTETYDGDSGGVVYNGQGWFKYKIANKKNSLGGCRFSQ